MFLIPITEQGSPYIFVMVFHKKMFLTILEFLRAPLIVTWEENCALSGWPHHLLMVLGPALHS